MSTEVGKGMVLNQVKTHPNFRVIVNKAKIKISGGVRYSVFHILVVMEIPNLQVVLKFIHS